MHNRLFYCFFLRGLLKMETGGAGVHRPQTDTTRTGQGRLAVHHRMGVLAWSTKMMEVKSPAEPAPAGTVEVEVDAVATWDASSVTSCHGLQLGPPPGPV